MEETNDYIKEQMRRLESCFGMCPDPVEYRNSLSKYTEQQLRKRVTWLINNWEMGFPKIATIHKCIENAQDEFVTDFFLKPGEEWATKEDYNACKAWIQQRIETKTNPYGNPIDFFKNYPMTKYKHSNKEEELFF
jgi:hypothetical protein